MKNARSFTLFVAGVAVGAIMISPAGAHIGSAVEHLWGAHLKSRVTGLVYTKAQANNRFFRGSSASFNLPPNNEALQPLPGPFSLDCQSDKMTVSYKAPEPVIVILDDGAGFTIRLPLDSGDSYAAPYHTSPGTRVATWITLSSDSYTRYMVTMTRGVPNCEGTLETIQNPG